MRIRSFCRRHLLVAALTLAVSPLALRAADGTFDRSFTVSGPVNLSAETHSGNITVRTGGAGTVSIHGTIRVRDRYSDEADGIIQQLKANPPVEQSGNSIFIRNVSDEQLRRKISISYEVVTPVDTTAEVQSGSGNIGVDGIRGPADTRSGSGNVNVAHVAGKVDASTGSGNIDFDSVAGGGKSSTGSGNITARGMSGDFIGTTGSGNVIVDFTTSGSVEMSSGSGNLEARGVQGGLRASTGSGDISADGQLKSNWNLKTSSGSVRVKLPAEAAFNIEARSSSGSIEVNHPLTVQGRIAKNQVQGVVRGGGALLAVSTSSGSIRVD